MLLIECSLLTYTPSPRANIVSERPCPRRSLRLPACRKAQGRGWGFRKRDSLTCECVARKVRAFPTSTARHEVLHGSDERHAGIVLQDVCCVCLRGDDFFEASVGVHCATTAA